MQSTHTYGYATDSWKDRLTSYNGSTITYDAIGNPLTYNNGSAYTFTWEGRQMQTATKGNTTWTYTYNADGLRTGKSNGSAVYTYTWNENRQLQSMTWNYGYAIFSYDANGMPYSVKNYDAILDVERTYLYITSLQGDVLSIIDASSGATAVTYTYDAWGRLIGKDGTSSDYASIYEYNPLTYRGYIYDSETGFYYLQSRYYDPTVGRFLNADSKMGISTGILSCELYCYCGNSPVYRIDTSGCAWWNIFKKVVFSIVAVVAVAHIVNAATALSQADYNRSRDIRSIVSNQHKIDMKLGCKTFAQMGCGAAATHNAIILAGGSSSLAEVVEFMQAHDLTLGFAGVYFTNIQLYLNRKGYSNKIYLRNLNNNIDQIIKNCNRKIAILAYKHSTGGHYVAIRYDSFDKKFYVYNFDETLNSVDTWIKSNSYSPLCLITI